MMTEKVWAVNRDMADLLEDDAAEPKQDTMISHDILRKNVSFQNMRQRGRRKEAQHYFGSGSPQ